MKYFLLLCLCALGASSASAQEDIDKIFEDFDKQQKADFEEFKNKADAEFETFLRETWEKYDAFAPVPVPTRPEPPTPVAFDKTKPELPPISVKPASIKVPDAPAPPTVGPSKGPDIRRPDLPAIGNTPAPGVYVPGQPYVPVMVPVPVPKHDPVVSRTEIYFYGTTFEVATGAVEGLVLEGNKEGHIADAWKEICRKDYEQFVADCRNIKEKHKLGDWAYILFAKQIGTELYGADRVNEIVFLQMFLLNKSGYKARLAKIDDKLKLMIAPAGTIYATPYLNIGGDKYYVFEPLKGGSMSIYTYRQNFADAKNLVCLNIDGVPSLDVAEQNRSLTPSTKAFSVQTTVNKNLLDFYRDYPQCDVAIHYHAPMSEALRAELYPQLKAAIEGKSQADAANILIDFVQTAFEYQTDGEQFGYEKPFFPDETFFYPYCDCEDRAMLFSTLVKDLLGLDAVLLDYPGHIASAVRFTDEVAGDAIVLDDGSKYLICDPTYIGAPIGACMPQFKEVAPEIIR